MHILIVCKNGGNEMIEEIIKLRGDGLSFRKIALKLNTTVGRVQYRWNKWINKSQDHDFTHDLNNSDPKEIESAEGKSSLPLVSLNGELQIKLVSPRKVLLIWGLSDIQRKIIKLFFNREFEELVQVVRIYDVTDIIFNGKNAHYFHEITIPYNNGHWFINGLVANRSYLAELGVYFSENEYFPILRSNSVHTPIGELSNDQDQDILPFQQYKDQPPKWIDHVSTYSYYGKSNTVEENNG
jgi:uncharacterized protein